MEAELIIKSIMGLVALLALLMFLLFLEPNSTQKSQEKPSDIEPAVQDGKKEPRGEAQKKELDLNYLAEIIKNKKSDSKKLQYALDAIIKYHGKVHKKLGLRAHPDFDIYIDILFTLCRHPNANKNLIINFDRELERQNPEYKQEINEAITKGLNSRGI
jgi:lipopolysaccharide export LptBFGC system permease protein LptF